MRASSPEKMKMKLKGSVLMAAKPAAYREAIGLSEERSRLFR
jgi:hypothetical protein